MTELTDEAVKTLLDGTTPGPWYWEETHPENACAVVLAKSEDGHDLEIATLYGCTDGVPAPTTPDEPWGDHPIRRADAALCAAAPVIARALLDARAENARLRADAQAAVALVVERAVEIGANIAQRTRPDGFPEEASNAYHSGAMDVVDAIRALAPPSGMDRLAELRAEIERLTRWRAEEGQKIKRQAQALTDLQKHCQRIEAEKAGLARKIGAVQRSGDDLAHSELADLQARVHNQRQEIARLRAERDRLRAAAQAAQAQCCMCGKSGLSTAEDGGPECELHDGRWVCSSACWETASALADTDGLAAVDALRKERDSLRQSLDACIPAVEEAAIKRGQAEAERDRLAAANAVLEAKLARLAGALASAASHLWFAATKMKGRCSGSDVSAIKMAEANARAALAEVQADARREGGE